MSFTKALDLLRTAEMAASKYSGVSLNDIEEEFSVDRRTAQRMTKALEDLFQNVTIKVDDERKKYWKLSQADAKLMLSQGLRDSELSALEMSIVRAEREGSTHEVQALKSLRDRLLAAMPGTLARRAEADAEAVLEAYGYASRPGPKVRTTVDLLPVIAQALKGPHLLTISYEGVNDNAPKIRLVEPYGLLLGARRYLVGKVKNGSGKIQHFRMDRIVHAQLEASSFSRDPNFDLAQHAARAFGSYHADQEYGEVVWKFKPSASEVARSFIFHPDQELTDLKDGSLVVKFSASGWLEMAWHIYRWGDALEVLSPEPLRDLVRGFARSDFPALP